MLYLKCVDLHNAIVSSSNNYEFIPVVAHIKRLPSIQHVLKLHPYILLPVIPVKVILYLVILLPSSNLYLFINNNHGMTYPISRDIMYQFLACLALTEHLRVTDCLFNAIHATCSQDGMVDLWLPTYRTLHVLVKSFSLRCLAPENPLAYLFYSVLTIIDFVPHRLVAEH